MPEPHLRASDRDRTAVATALGEHMAAGRLTLAEYEERLTKVYETKTFGGLAALTADLPPTPGTRTPSSAPARRPQSARAAACARNGWHGDGHGWDAWRRTALIVLTIWAATSLAAWEFLYFWPVWVIGPWGAVLLAGTIGGRDERQRLRA
jgi:Domain of unknown function (DUF1707)